MKNPTQGHRVGAPQASLHLLGAGLLLLAGLYAQKPTPTPRPSPTPMPSPAPALVAAAAPAPAGAAAINAGGAISISHYHLDLNFDLPKHALSVDAKVEFTAQQPLTTVTFRLGSIFQVDRVSDPAGDQLSLQRQPGAIAITYPAPVSRGTAETLEFRYHGILNDPAFSPIAGIQTTYAGADGAFLLYPGDWFPLANYGTGRFTATISATLPPPFGLIASGEATATPVSGPAVRYVYRQQHASLPGSIAVTALHPQTFQENGIVENFYFRPEIPATLVQQYAQSAGAIVAFLTQRFGPPPANTLHFIELPANSLPSFSSPNLIFLSRTSIGNQVNANLLVDEIAQQWFGDQVTPATLNDAWLQYGAARFAEALYVQKTEGQAAYQKLIRNLEVGALTYPQVSLANTATLDPFSPQFQELTYDKGALLFHMLRWVLGDQPLWGAMRQFLQQNAGQPVTTAQFEQALEGATKINLKPFFAEWYHGAASPEFHDQYTVYRLGAGGYRVTGQILQPLELFQMPVDVRVETRSGVVNQTVFINGINTSFSIPTKAIPLTVTIDPQHWVLAQSPDLNLSVDVARGDNAVSAGDFTGAVKQYDAALKINPISSLAHYRLAEANYQQQDWQKAADEYRQAIHGDNHPSWTKVWSYLQLGKIFDRTGQRARALNEYQRALATQDDTAGALELAQQYLKTPYHPRTAS